MIPLKMRASHQHFIMPHQLSITFNTIELVPCAYSFEVVHGCPVPVLLVNRRSKRPREQSTDRPKSLILGDNSHQIQVLSILKISHYSTNITLSLLALPVLLTLTIGWPWLYYVFSWQGVSTPAEKTPVLCPYCTSKFFNTLTYDFCNSFSSTFALHSHKL